MKERFHLPFRFDESIVVPCNSVKATFPGSLTERSFRIHCVTVAGRAGSSSKATVRVKICGVYCFLHRETGRRYIGSSLDCYYRKGAHIKYCHKNLTNHFSRHLHQLGNESFDFIILEETSPKARFRREKFWISHYDTTSEKGFNTWPDPTKMFNHKLSPASLRRLSEAHMGNRHTLATRRKMSRTRKGKKLPKEWCENISKGLIGNYPSAATRKKLSESAKRRFQDPAQRALVSRINKGRKHTKKFKLFVSKFMKGNKFKLGTKWSPEQRRKMAEIVAAKKQARQNEHN